MLEAELMQTRLQLRASACAGDTELRGDPLDRSPFPSQRQYSTLGGR